MGLAEAFGSGAAERGVSRGVEVSFKYEDGRLRRREVTGLRASRIFEAAQRARGLEPDPEVGILGERRNGSAARFDAEIDEAA